MGLGSWVARVRAVSALAALLLFWGCGGDAGLSINTPTGQCVGGSGPQIEGVVRMPDGQVARADSAVERFASVVWSRALAISGDVLPVGAGVKVDLIELRQEDVENGTEPGAVEVTTTNENGQYCIRLPGGTDHNVCRYVLQVGNADDRTLTRAFLFSSTEPIDIDFQSEATVRLILAEIPPATLCDFSPDEIRNIYNAVRIAPGTATGEDADEINAVASSIAAADPVVDAALAAAFDRPRTPTASPSGGAPPSPASPTPPPGSTPTRTEIVARTATFTPRPPAPTRTATPPGGNPTVPRSRTPTP